ncbi:MAG: hypothetical protein ABIO55_17270, partial [Ginsengibacter sp.]
MPDVNDDMDELFKKAAENYPLNTDSSDWNEVYKTLRPLNQPVNNTGDKKNSRRFLWLLLLLIPAAISINKYVFNAEHKNAQAEISSKKHMTSSPEQKNTAKENLNTSEPKEAVHSKAILSTASNISSPSKSIAKKNPAQMVNRILPGDISPEKYSAGEPSNNNIDNGDVPALKSGAYNKIQEGAEVIETGINETAPASNEVATDLDVTKQSNINQSAESKITQQQDKTEPVADTTKQRINNTPKLKGRQQRFYAGIVAGPDFSTIKFQKIIKTGFTAGVIAGYRLNKKLSIESGFFLD